VARYFDGVDDNVSIGSPSVLNLPGTTLRTFCVWIRAKTKSNFNVFFTSDINLASGVQFRLQLDGSASQKIQSNIRNSGGTDVPIVSTTVPVVGTWYFVAGTYDGTTHRLFINAVQENSQVMTPTSNNLDAGVWVGRYSGAGALWNGDIAHASIYKNVSLTSSQLKQIMYFPGSITNGLVGYWPLLGGSPEPDYSGNKNNGTVTGATVSADNPPINGMFTVPKPELAQVF